MNSPSKTARQLEQALSGLLGLLRNPLVTEVMATPDGCVWVDAKGSGQTDTGLVLSETERLNIITLTASANNRTIDESNPRLAAELPHRQERFQGHIKPAVKGPAFSIRVPGSDAPALSSYVERGSMTPQQEQAIEWGVRNHKNFIIAGGTGSGKTTLSNAIIECMTGMEERFVTIEDQKELVCTAANVYSMFVSRTGPFRYIDALEDALRLRPDRIIVGEIRSGDAALALLDAWNTGHPGGLTTLHANSAQATLSRLEGLLERVVAKANKAMITEAIDVLVYTERYNEIGPDGGKKPAWRIREVVLIADTLGENGDYQQTHHYPHTSLIRRP